ncbi:MAG: dehydrogenase, partial [Caldilineaceae bacterium]|nr:dehydrogenase [Caldilineaceae bacterium]
MPKSLPIDPTTMRQPGVLTAPSIPLNRYRTDPQRETDQYGSASLVRIYRDMLYLRAFETMLDQLKREGVYAGIRYTHAGPAHLSIGQEAAAVGQCVALEPYDLIFGSHRSHGEILAKGLAAIAKLDEAALQRIMETYLDGTPLRAVERLAAYDSIHSMAIDYLLYGTLAEIFGRDTGFNRGMGGSMHAFFPPFGIMPNNAIVGGSADIAVGAALFKRINRKPGIVIANIGDASLACGPVWEAMIFAAMDQYQTLWPREVGGAPPILFNFMNNFYGMGGQPVGETMGMGVLARVGLGVNPDAMHAERVDGFSPLAVADAVARQRELLLAGQGPALLDTVTYRFSGHSPSDASAYRERDEIERWREQDSLVAYQQAMLEQGHATADELEALDSAIQERLTRVLTAAISPDRSPRIQEGTTIAGLIFSHQRRERLDDRTPEVLQTEAESRLHVTHAKHRVAFDATGQPHPRNQCLTYAEAIFEAMMHRFYRDPTMVAYGEENRDWGGAFAVYRGLTEALPYHRLFNAPIAEAAIVGSAVGYALSGGRVVVELMYCDFMGRAGDEIFNQMAKWQAMSGGVLTMPMVL